MAFQSLLILWVLLSVWSLSPLWSCCMWWFNNVNISMCKGTVNCDSQIKSRIGKIYLFVIKINKIKDQPQKGNPWGIGKVPASSLWMLYIRVSERVYFSKEKQNQRKGQGFFFWRWTLLENYCNWAISQILVVHMILTKNSWRRTDTGKCRNKYLI